MLYINKNVTWRFNNNYESSVLYNTKTGAKLKLNELGTKIFTLKYISHATEEDIIVRMKGIYPDVSIVEIKRDVHQYLESIQTTEFFTDNPKNRGFLNLIKITPPLERVLIEVTRKCNFNCLHCIVGSPSYNNFNNNIEMSTEDILRLIEECQTMKVYTIVFTGGEPLLRPDLPEFINECSSRGMKPIIFTNGSLITKKFLSSVKKTGLQIRFSIDGATADTNDYIRGNSSFLKVITSMELCKSNNFDIAISSTINHINVHEIPGIIEIGEKYDVTEIEIGEIQCGGNAAKNTDLLLTKEESIYLREETLKLITSNQKVRKGMRIYEMLEKNLDKNGKLVSKKHCCNAGISICFISSDGELYPCSAYRDIANKFEAGNLKEERLFYIWRDSEIFTILRNLKPSYIESCRNCICLKECPCGCRAVALKESGRIDGPMNKNFCDVSRAIKTKLISGELSITSILNRESNNPK